MHKGSRGSPEEQQQIAQDKIVLWPAAYEAYGTDRTALSDDARCRGVASTLEAESIWSVPSN